MQAVEEAVLVVYMIAVRQDQEWVELEVGHQDQDFKQQSTESQIVAAVVEEEMLVPQKHPRQELVVVEMVGLA
jgi:hypothetical protein